MKETWGVISFKLTAQYPNSCVINASIWPILGAVPAMKKLGVFASHFVDKFSYFLITKKQILITPMLERVFIGTKEHISNRHWPRN